MLLWFIANRLFLENNFSEQVDVFQQSFSWLNTGWLAAAIFLMPLNWWLETKKWQTMLDGQVSFQQALKSVLVGVTLGFVSPARLGEFAGRIWHLPTELRTQAFYLSNIGGLAQTAVTLSIGSICFSLWIDNPFLAANLAGLSAFFLLLFFRFDWVNRLIQQISLLRQTQLTISNEELPDIRTQISVLSFSALRYGVYLLQYVFMFKYFGVAASLFTLIVHCGLLLLANSFSPLLPILDFSFRGTIALFVFKEISSNTIALLCGTTFIWLLNLVVPALLGYLFIIRKEKQS